MRKSCRPWPSTGTAAKDPQHFPGTSELSPSCRRRPACSDCRRWGLLLWPGKRGLLSLSSAWFWSLQFLTDHIKLIKRLETETEHYQQAEHSSVPAFWFSDPWEPHFHRFSRSCHSRSQLLLFSFWFQKDFTKDKSFSLERNSCTVYNFNSWLVYETLFFVNNNKIRWKTKKLQFLKFLQIPGDEAGFNTPLTDRWEQQRCWLDVNVMH